MEFWKTLIAPVIVALIGGYLIKGLEKPTAAAVVAKINWLDTSNPFAPFDVKKVFDGAYQKKDLDAITKLAAAAGGYVQVRIASINLKNTSNLVAKQTEITLNQGGAIFWYDSEKRPQLASSVKIDTLPPGADLSFTLIMRPFLLEPHSGVLITHDGKRVDPSVARVDNEFQWMVDAVNNHPIAVIPLAMLSLASLALLLIVLASAFYIGDSLERRARLIGGSEAKRLARLVKYLQDYHPDKLI